jgi:pyruvate/2-oxoglutarate dehydrogenase complex dihydrolipoamide acyltransferase (E2) component
MRDTTSSVRPPLVIGCGALARELVELTRHAGLPAMDLTCLPASLHNRPEHIPGAVTARIRRARADGYDRIFVAYADCGTGGLLDRALEAEGVARLEGAHCYEVYAGRAAFAALSDAEPGTFYLTDFLVRNFDRLVVRGLGLDRHPELLPMYFGNYRRLLYLAQTEDPELAALAEAAALRLGLTFERRFVGLGEVTAAIRGFMSVGPASDEHSRRPSAAWASERVSNLRVTRDVDGSAVKSVGDLRQVTDDDDLAPAPVRNVHRTQASAANRRRMQQGNRPAASDAADRRRMQERNRRAASAARRAASPARRAASAA